MKKIFENKNKILKMPQQSNLNIFTNKKKLPVF